jgi:hypothetical protein
MKNRIESALKAFESPIRCGSPVFWAGIRRRLVWSLKKIRSPLLVQVRVLIFLTKSAKRLAAT